jgi:hypothetical protein
MPLTLDETSLSVMQAKAGIQDSQRLLDPVFRRGDAGYGLSLPYFNSIGPTLPVTICPACMLERKMA